MQPDEMVMVIGIGADGWSGLSTAARAAIESAQVVFGSRRQLGLLPEVTARQVQWPSPMLPAVLGLLAEQRGKRRCVLASGDPMFFGLGTYLIEQLGVNHVRVLPQVSSVSLACARLGWPLESTPIISLLGRPIETVRRPLAPGRRLLVLSPDQNCPAEVAKLITADGYGASRLTVLEELGGPDERITCAVAADWTEPVAPLNVLAIECVADSAVEPTGAFGISDKAYEHDGQLTKREVRAVTLARLAPSAGQLLWDVGAGAGSIAIEWLRLEPSCRAVAVERDPVRAGRISRNAASLGVPGLQIVTGAAPQALDELAELSAPDAIFIGGGLTVAGLFDTCWRALKPGGRLVANAVTLESEAVLLSCFASHGGELSRIVVNTAAAVGGFTGWRAGMPVTIWTAVKS